MEKSTTSKLIKSSAIVIVVFGFICFLSIINPFAFELNDQDPQRNLASVQLSNKTVASESEKFKTETIVYNCNQGTAKSVVVNHKTSQVQIQGQHCDLQEHKFSSTRISNVTNQFEATVFELRRKTFTSDFIQIDSGTNIIEIEESSDSGIKRISKLIVKKQQVEN